MNIAIDLIYTIYKLSSTIYRNEVTVSHIFIPQQYVTDSLKKAFTKVKVFHIEIGKIYMQANRGPLDVILKNVKADSKTDSKNGIFLSKISNSQF